MSESLAHWLSKLEQRHPRSIDMGLDRCSKVYRTLGSPRPANMLISVAGTNGKGSVVAYLSSVLQACGLNCGSYTSPHLLKFNERVVINGVPVSDQHLTGVFELVEMAMQGTSLTYFEFTTLAAFQLMNQAGLDLAVLEVGLGGRLDTVNVVDPDCSVITPIGLDHQDYLGDNRESIGREKAGIIRPGIPVVCSDRNPPLSILHQARELDAKLLLLGSDFDWKESSGGLQLTIGEQIHKMPRPVMAGSHQLDNLAAALTAAQLLVPDFFKHQPHWSRAINELALAGRLASISADRRFLLDVGHNAMAAQAVAAHIEIACPSRGKVICVLGMLKDKDAEAVSNALDMVVDQWFCAGLSGSRSQSGAALKHRVCQQLPTAQVRAFDTVAGAVREAGERAGPEDFILVFGSFETVAATMCLFSQD